MFPENFVNYPSSSTRADDMQANILVLKYPLPLALSVNSRTRFILARLILPVAIVAVFDLLDRLNWF